jgi:dTDP-4-amino-4,6-dideoxygalactose transaminase
VTDIPWEITLADVTIGDEERRAVDDVLRSGWLSMGPRTEVFEADFRAMLGGGHTVAVTNGTAALHLAAAALGIGAGDEVIVPALTFVASAAAMRQAGASVRLADSTSLQDFNLAPDEIERLAGPRTRAIVVVHYAGYPADMDAITSAAERHGLLVIEDAAHAVGASLSGRSCGNLGDAGCFSFFPNKNMTTGEGGMVVLRDPDIAARARALRSHAMTTMTWDRHRGHASEYDVVEVGFNYRIDEMRAALGVEQLRRLPAANARRAELSRLYARAIDEIDGIEYPTHGERGESAHHLAVAVLESQDRRDAVRALLREHRIQTSIHYPSINRFSSYTGGGSLPVAEAIADRSVTLPLHPGMRDEDVARVAELLAEACL